MDATTAIDILNELLAWERGSLVARLAESGVFVSRPAVADLEALQSMARKTTEHVQWLSEAIMHLGGTPGFRFADASTGDLHYLELHHVLPRLISDREALIRKYTTASQRLAEEPAAASLVQRVLERHRESLATIRTAQHTQTAAPV